MSLTDPVAPNGDSEQFVSYYQIEMPRLVRFVIKLGADYHTAADIAQTAFMKAWPEWPAIRSPDAWLRRVASRDFIHQARRIREEPVDQIPDHSPIATAGPGAANLSADPVVLGEQQRAVLAALARLPRCQREVLAWRYDGFTPN
jgi:RNA polymerase sigma factor (sigma-70 family)